MFDVMHAQNNPRVTVEISSAGPRPPDQITRLHLEPPASRRAYNLGPHLLLLGVPVKPNEPTSDEHAACVAGIQYRSGSIVRLQYRLDPMRRHFLPSYLLSLPTTIAAAISPSFDCCIDDFHDGLEILFIV